MAEQALNAIYLLGEQPDVLAGTLIKDFTVRTFDAANPDQVADRIEGLTLEERETAVGEEPAPEQDPDASMSVDVKPADDGEGQGLKKSSSMRSLAGSELVSSFELGQLIFVVGHVAIKQIVYLEIVERELKRRKEQQAAASALSCVYGERAHALQSLILGCNPFYLGTPSQSRKQEQGRKRSRPGLRQRRRRHWRQHGLHPRV
jgi:condensin complex subunit 1